MNLPEGANNEPYTAEEQLALSDEEDALPWLEDDGEYEDEGGFDARSFELLVGFQLTEDQLAYNATR